MREDKVIAYLEVLFVAEHSASCRLLESTGSIQINDEALVLTTIEISATPPSARIDTVSVSQSERPRAVKKSVKTNRVTGRIALDSQWNNDLESTNADVAEPSLSGRMRIEKIGGSHLSFDLKLRLRRVIRSRESAGATETQWNNRLYEAALAFDSPDSKVGYRAGRFVANAISGMGYIDGALGSYRLNENWSAGAFLGTDPDLRNTDFQTDRVKSGVYARFAKSHEHTPRVAGTLAVAGQYQDGEASREFLYQQISAAPSSKLSVYESAELNLNRGWREQADGALLLSSFLFSTTWNPHKNISADLGYDNRRNFHTFETRNAADSLFDDAVRQSLRGGLRVRFAKSFYSRATLGIRGLRDDFSESGNVSFACGSTNLLHSRCGVETTYSTYHNSFSDGDQWSLSARRSISHSLQVNAASGQDSYRIKSVNSDVTQQWIRLSGDATLSRHFYSSAQTEIRRGEGIDGNFYSLELGYRF
jgi:hypothetical protein